MKARASALSRGKSAAVAHASRDGCWHSRRAIMRGVEFSPPPSSTNSARAPLLSALDRQDRQAAPRPGASSRRCCPFHNEKTPSFYVNDDKGFYHCFGCWAHGDAIRWMTDQRGLPFIDAVKELAQAAGHGDARAGPPARPKRAERAKGLHEAMADAAAWFTEQLNGIDGARGARAAREARRSRPTTAQRVRPRLRARHARQAARPRSRTTATRCWSRPAC